MKAFLRWFSSTFMTDIYTGFDLAATLFILYFIRNTADSTNFLLFTMLWISWCLIGKSLVDHLKNKIDTTTTN